MDNPILLGLALFLALGFGGLCGWSAAYKLAYQNGRMDERNEWNDVNEIVKRNIAKAQPYDSQGEFISIHPDAPCPYNVTGQHSWHEVTTLGQSQGERHYRCSFCMAKKTEQTLV